MRTEQFGPVRLIRWSWDVERRLRAEAREHLLKKFQVGTYDDPVMANAILQHQFEFYADRLERAVDILANRDGLEFVLTQYEMAASITHGLHALHVVERSVSRWTYREPCSVGFGRAADESARAGVFSREAGGGR
jgi:hypothetical protein